MSTGRVVLVVDDDRYLCNLLSDALTDGRYEVHCAHDGEAAWTAIHEQAPDLVISDISVPNLDSLSLTRRLAEAGSSVPIILMRGDTNVRAAAGAAVLLKPFTLDDLLDLMARG
jgi:DNA-binding response OmpR family regulator